jgi:hypothetical protein
MNVLHNAARALAAGLLLSLAAAPIVHADEHDRGHREWRDHEFHEHEFRDRRYYDSRFHHDHYYPPPGFVFGGIGPGFNIVLFGGHRLYFSAGVWYRLEGPGRYVVVTPPVGVVVPVPPPYYTTVYVNGVPYYYANNTYYTQTPQGYMVVDPPPPNAMVQTTPPPAPASPPPAPVAQAPTERLFVYPTRGQSEQQQTSDRAQCHNWAVGQVGVDPNTSPSGASDPRYGDYKRALSACLESRGYTVR